MDQILPDTYLREALDLPIAPPGSQELVPVDDQATKPRGAQRYPTSAMPLFHQMAAEMGQYVEIVAAYATSLASACLPRVRIVSPEDWLTRAATWTVALGEAGSGKTPTYRRLREQLVEIMEEESTAFSAAKAEWRELQKRADGVATKETVVEATHRPEPTSATLFYEDGTLEGLRQACALKKANGLVPAKSPVVDELGAFLDGIGQYKSRKDADLKSILKLWSDGFGTVLRVTGETEPVYDAYVVVAGGIQTGERVENILGNFDNGMTARWLVHYLPIDIATKTRKQVESPVTDTHWDDRIIELYRSSDKERTWTLDAEAVTLWETAKAHWGKEKVKAGYCHLGHALAKANEQSLRLMAVYSELLDLADHTVTAEVARYAIEVTDYCMSYWSLRVDHESATVSYGDQKMDRFMNVIERKINESTEGVLTSRELQRALRSIRKEDLSPILSKWGKYGITVHVIKGDSANTERILVARKHADIDAWIRSHAGYRKK